MNPKYETVSTEEKEDEEKSIEKAASGKTVRFEDKTKSNDDESDDLVDDDVELQSSKSNDNSKEDNERNEQENEIVQKITRERSIDDGEIGINQNRTPDIYTPASMRKQNNIRQIDLIAVTFLVVSAACLVFFFALRQTDLSILSAQPSAQMTFSSFPSSYPSTIPSSSSEPTISPTISSQPSIKDLREKFLLETINRASPKSALPSIPLFDILNRTEFPQINAAEWLLFEDRLQIQENYFQEEIIDRFALATIYFATNGKLGENWLTNTTVCEWEGIMCDKDPPHKITQLSMVNFDLKGMIPAEIALLGSLTDLFLDHNFLQHVDPDLFSLMELRTLDLSNNELQGTFPTEINMLPNLSDLYLSFNDFTGNFDGIDEINLQKLEIFHLHSNLITGEVPDAMCALFNQSLVDMWADCGGEMPMLHCKCCTLCFP